MTTPDPTTRLRPHPTHHRGPAAGAAGGGRAHGRSDHRRRAELRRRAQRTDGGDDQDRGPARARRVHLAGGDAGQARADPHGACRRRCLPARPRRGAQRPHRRRAALRLPDRGAGGVAGDVLDRGAQRGGRGDPGRLRRAGLRLHRRAVRGQRGGAHRRARHDRAGTPAAPRAARRSAAGRGAGRRRRAVRREGRVGAAGDPHGGDRPRLAGAGGAGRRTRGDADGQRRARRDGAAAGPERARSPPGGAPEHPGGQGCGRRSGQAVAAGAGLLRPGAAGPPAGPGHRQRGAPRGPGAHRGPGRARRPAGQGAGTPGGAQRDQCREAHRDAALAGCSTTAAATRWPPTCSCTPRRCATAWASCARSSATGWRTPRRSWS